MKYCIGLASVSMHGAICRGENEDDYYGCKMLTAVPFSKVPKRVLMVMVGVAIVRVTGVVVVLWKLFHLGCMCHLMSLDLRVNLLEEMNASITLTSFCHCSGGIHGLTR
eukprot:8654186-Ditylum_brightwellii.AAC.2